MQIWTVCCLRLEQHFAPCTVIFLCLAEGLDVQGTERLRVVVDTFGRNSCKSQVNNNHKQACRLVQGSQVFCCRDCQQSSQTFTGCRLLTTGCIWPSRRSLAGACKAKTPLITRICPQSTVTAEVLVLCRLNVLGGIKTGNKKLFIRAETASFYEIEPVCVLDFYVHEDYQRKGLGKHLFEVRFQIPQVMCIAYGCHDACTPGLNVYATVM